MEPIHILAALASALLHAGWNAAVKASPRPPEVMTAQMAMAALLVLPGFAWVGLPPPETWPWVLASTALNVVTISALLKAYELVGFGIAYPVARALSVLLVVPLAARLAGEMPSGYGLAGIALVALSLALLASGRHGGAGLSGRAAFWIVVSGVTTAAYVVCDGNGVRVAGSAPAYGFAVSVTNGIAMLAFQRASGIGLGAVARHWVRAIPIALASIVSYLLILWVWTLAPIAPAAALRDMSALFALVIAVVWLREPVGRRQLFAVLLAAAAVPLLRLA